MEENKLHKSLKEINDKGDLTQPHLEVLGDVLDAILDSCKIHKMSEPVKDYDFERSYRMPDMGRYDDGMRSYNDGMSYNDMSYNDGYRNSYDKDPYMRELEEQLRNAKNDHERNVIRRMISDRSHRM